MQDPPGPFFICPLKMKEVYLYFIYSISTKTKTEINISNIGEYRLIKQIKKLNKKIK